MKQKPINRKPRGFALIVTLSLMILLTVIAVGLLSISVVSLRSSNHQSAAATARSNARLALMLAIGELQKNAGPDTRISAPGNLVDPAIAPGITGIWKSWRPPAVDPDYEQAKTGANFLGYLMSNPDITAGPDPAKTPVPNAGSSKLVGTNSVGTGNARSEISAPVIRISKANSSTASGGVSWVTLDEGVKGRIDLLPAAEPSGQGDTVTQVGSPARNGFESVDKLDFLNADDTTLHATLPKLVSLAETDLGDGSTGASSRYFNDFTVSSGSVQADVANGGLKTDLSVLFDGPYGSSVPSGYDSRYVYSDTSTPYQGVSTTSDIQWGLYANYTRLYRRTTGNDNPKVGLKAALPANYGIRSINDATLGKNRFESNMGTVKQPILMPTVVRIDSVFSIIARDAHSPHNDNPEYPMMLHFMYLPVVTLHNPFNVPLRVTNLQVEFADLPVGFEFLVNGQPTTTSGLMPINSFFNGTLSGTRKTFSMTLSNSLSSATEVVMGAGETRIFGTPFPADSTWAQEVGSNGRKFFDWQSNMTGGVLTTPGMITGPTDGVGFDVDFLAPSNPSAWVTARNENGIVNLKNSDSIQVRFGPKAPLTADSAFAVTLRMGTAGASGVPVAGRTQVFYMNEARLETILEEGTSPRFPEVRSFPEVYPRVGSSPITAQTIYESNGTKVKDYVRAKPFAIFSIGAKTTVESFTKSRPVADTGAAFQMATCDFSSSATAGASPLEFSLVPIKSGGLAIESGGIQDSRKTPIQGFFFGGHGSTNGTNNATLYEIPMAPLQSIAQLRHANGGSISSVPYVTYSIGESRAHPAIPSSASFFKPDASRICLDHSWLGNDQLWDRYWFSTLATLQGVAYGGSSSMTQDQLAKDFFAGKRSLPNTRNTPYMGGGKSADEMAADARNFDASTGITRSSAYILTKGGFNVNSTSVAAWRSVLSALSTSDVPLAAGALDNNPPGTPFLRQRQPVSGRDGSGTPREKLWNSYRTLDEREIDILAEEIVAEVRKRGPFLSMSEFVNRRLGSAGELTNAGAIQAAIDRTAINDSMTANARPVGPSDVASYGWKNNDAVNRNTGAGSPGEVSQGDVLSSMGSFATVRSDTFRIRASGDARDAAGVVIARAWCEATVQRVPDFVDASDPPHTLISAANKVNQAFGRQFKIMAFRWLHENEI